MASVEWGEYKIGELFNKKTIKGIPKSEENLEENNNGYHVYGQNISYQYPQKVINDSKYLTVLEKDKPIIAYTSSTAQIGIINESFYRTGNNGAFQGLFPKFSENNFKVVIFILECIKRTFIGFGYNTSMANILDIVIQVPTKNNKLDFDFMEDFIAELEAERIAELSAYLTVSGLDNYELSIEERNALRAYNSMEWREYRIGSIFSRISTKKLPYKAKDLPTEVKDGYDLPCLTSSFRNQGLNYYVPRDGATILKNVISIPSNSDVYRAYFQSREFTVLSDAYAIKWADEDKELSNYQYLFMVRAINKVTDLPIYSYKMKLGGWNVVKDKKILLPVIDDEIAFDFMNDYTRAVSKLAIKDVVQYTDRRIEATEEVVKGHQENR